MHTKDESLAIRSIGQFKNAVSKKSKYVKNNFALY